MSIFELNHCGTGVTTGACDNQLPQFVEIIRGNGLRERQFARKDRWDTNLIGLDIDVRGNDRTGGVIDTFALTGNR